MLSKAAFFSPGTSYWTEQLAIEINVGGGSLRTLSANRYIDFGDGLGISPSDTQAISGLLDLRFSSDPNDAKLIDSVYR